MSGDTILGRFRITVRVVEWEHPRRSRMHAAYRQRTRRRNRKRH